MIWQDELKSALRSAEDLFREGFIRAEEVEAYQRVISRFPFFLTRYYAGLINKENPKCPIRLQAIPSLEELETDGHFTTDPLSDLAYKPAPHITHRYRDRVLLHLTPNCSMVCRFCFRKSLLTKSLSQDLLRNEAWRKARRQGRRRQKGGGGLEGPASTFDPEDAVQSALKPAVVARSLEVGSRDSQGLFEGSIQEGINYIAGHPEIREVIFSGGDPWMVSSEKLESVLGQIERIFHVSRVRFHTRVPVTLPDRIDDDLMRVLARRRFAIVVVAHFNHPKEITAESASAVGRLLNGKYLILNQSVLLRGVNDSAPVLKELWEKLFEISVVPYYLHHPDRASGTRHFDLPLEVGLRLYDKAREGLPGYLVPKYVVDSEGISYKMPVSDYLFRFGGSSKGLSSSSIESESMVDMASAI